MPGATVSTLTVSVPANRSTAPAGVADVDTPVHAASAHTISATVAPCTRARARRAGTVAEVIEVIMERFRSNASGPVDRPAQRGRGTIRPSRWKDKGRGDGCRSTEVQERDHA